MSERRSRRTRGKRPEVVPPKSDEEPTLEEGDDVVDEQGSTAIALGAIHGRRRGRRSMTVDPSSTNTSARSKGTTSSSSSPSQTDKEQELQQDSLKILASVAKAAGTKKRARPKGRPHINSSGSPTPSQSSLSLSSSASESIVYEEEGGGGDDDDGWLDRKSNLFEESSDSTNGEDDDAERDTEDDAPKEALTGKKKKRGRPKKQKTVQEDEEKHARYKNSLKLKCRHCGKSLFSQGIKVHERSCMPVYAPREDDLTATDDKPDGQGKSSRSSSSDSRRSTSSSSSSDSSSPPSPVVIVRKKIGRLKKTSSTARKKEATVLSEPVKPFICRNCGRFFTTRGINAHEKRCMPVYTERESPSPDTNPVKKVEEKDEENPEMDVLLEKTAFRPQEDENNSNVPPPKPVFPCRYCGGMFKAQGIKKHEGSCLKKQRERVLSENAKIGVLKGETKKGKKADKGATKSVANVDNSDDSSWEDDASSTAKCKTVNGSSTISNEGKIVTAQKHNNNGSSGTLSSMTPQKRKRKRKYQSDTIEIDGKVVASDIVANTGDNSSPNALGDNAPRRKVKKSKAKVDVVSVEKTSKDVGRIKGDKVDSLATVSAVASTTKARKKSLTGNTKAAATICSKTNYMDAKGEKPTASKLLKAKTGTKTISKFFPKTSTSKSKTVPAESQVEGKSEQGDTLIQSGAETMPSSEQKGGTSTIINILLSTPSIIMKSVASENSASKESVSEDVTAGVDAKKTAVTSSKDTDKQSTDESETSKNVSKTKERRSKKKHEPYVVTKNTADLTMKTDFSVHNDRGGSIAEKGNKEMVQKVTITALNQRPIRKRKLTPKAAQAAANSAKATAIRDEKEMMDDGRIGVIIAENCFVRDKKLKTKHVSETEHNGPTPDDDCTKPSDVEGTAKQKLNCSQTDVDKSKASEYDDEVETNDSAADINHEGKWDSKDSVLDSDQPKESYRGDTDKSAPNDSPPDSDQPKAPDEEDGNKPTQGSDETKALDSEPGDGSESSAFPLDSDQPKGSGAENMNKTESSVSFHDSDEPKAPDVEHQEKPKSNISLADNDKPNASDTKQRDESKSSDSRVDMNESITSDAGYKYTYVSHKTQAGGSRPKTISVDNKDEPDFKYTSADASQLKALESEGRTKLESTKPTRATSQNFILDTNEALKTSSQRQTGTGIIVEAAKSAAAATLTAAFSLFSSKTNPDKEDNQLGGARGIAARIPTPEIQGNPKKAPATVAKLRGQKLKTATTYGNGSLYDDAKRAVSTEGANAAIINTTRSNKTDDGRSAESTEVELATTKRMSHQTTSLITSTGERGDTTVSPKIELLSNITHESVHATPATTKRNNEMAENSNLQPERRGELLENENIPSSERVDSNDKKENLSLTIDHSSENTNISEKDKGKEADTSDVVEGTNDAPLLSFTTPCAFADFIHDLKGEMDNNDTNQTSKKPETSNSEEESQLVLSENKFCATVTSHSEKSAVEKDGDGKQVSDTIVGEMTTDMSEESRIESNVKMKLQWLETVMDQAETQGLDKRQSTTHMTDEGTQETIEVQSSDKGSCSKIDGIVETPSEPAILQNTELSVENDYDNQSRFGKEEHRGQLLSMSNEFIAKDVKMSEGNGCDLPIAGRGSGEDKAKSNTDNQDVIKNKRNIVQDESIALEPTHSTTGEFFTKLQVDSPTSPQPSIAQPSSQGLELFTQLQVDSPTSPQPSMAQPSSQGLVDLSSIEKVAPEVTVPTEHSSQHLQPGDAVQEVKVGTEELSSSDGNEKLDCIGNNDETSSDEKSKHSPSAKNMGSSGDISNSGGISSDTLQQAKDSKLGSECPSHRHSENLIMKEKDETVNSSDIPVKEKEGTTHVCDGEIYTAERFDKVAKNENGTDRSDKIEENDVTENCNNETVDKPDLLTGMVKEMTDFIAGAMLTVSEANDPTGECGAIHPENKVMKLCREKVLDESDPNKKVAQMNHQVDDSSEIVYHRKKSPGHEAPIMPTAMEEDGSSRDHKSNVSKASFAKIDQKVLDHSCEESVANSAESLSKAKPSENQLKKVAGAANPVDASEKEQSSFESQPIAVSSENETEHRGIEKAESQKQRQLASKAQKDAMVPSTLSHIALGLDGGSGGDAIRSLLTVEGEKTLAITASDKTNTNEDAAKDKFEIEDTGGPRLISDSTHGSQEGISAPYSSDMTVNSIESKLGKNSADAVDMDVDSPLESGAGLDAMGVVRKEFDGSKTSLKCDTEDKSFCWAVPVKNEQPKKSICTSQRNAMPDDSESITHLNTGQEMSLATKVTVLSDAEKVQHLKTGQEMPLENKVTVLSDAEKLQVSWVPMSKASRQSRPVQRPLSSMGLQTDKTDRVKMLLYTTGSQVHRGKGFERIFAMYWDAICLRLSSPLSLNAFKRCDDAISEFLKTRKLRKIHNKFIMNVMRRTLKHRISYTGVSQYIPLMWQDRVKVPQVITSTKPPKKKRNPYFAAFKDDLMNISSVPHFDQKSPYKEVWDIPEDTMDKKEQNPQEGPTEPIASSCIPGALVVDPFLRDTVEANGMKVTDSAMWLLTVALKEYIKNLLNDSIEHKKGLEKGEMHPQTIQYPNVLATTSTKSKKVSKGKTSTATQEIVQKKHIGSLDLFAALNMLPSGHSSSVGGSISRMSLEHTFLSGFNSMQSFNAGSVFKDVQSFISHEITTMSKERKPEEKKSKPPPTKSIECRTDANRESKSVGGREERKKTQPLTRAKATKPIASPIPTTVSQTLTTSLSPNLVHTPQMGTNQPSASTSATDKNLATPQVLNKPQPKSNDPPPVDSSAGGSQGIGGKSKDSSEVKVVKVTKLSEQVTKGVQPSQSGAPRSGAGRGAKNLAALMARAAESNTQKESTASSLGVEKASANNPNAILDNKFAVQSTVIANVSTSEAQKPDVRQIQVGQPGLKTNADRTVKTTESSTHNQPKPNIAIESAYRNENEGASKEPSFPLPQRQTTAPIRRGKGKGFGSKDLAAMRARSMTTTKSAETNAADSAKDKLTGN